MQSVAEGVDSEECIRVLAELGCDSAQGYLISRPKDIHALQEWLPTRMLAMLRRAVTGQGQDDALSA
jgi:EAL domain-containing protein (putative c-di-GMP-specific phosphodiesterase class I)